MLTSRSTAALLSLLLGGCLSGQTGSPDCVGPTSCVCDTRYGGGVLLRVHGEAAADGALTAVVDEVFGSLYEHIDVHAGERVSGVVAVEKPCAREERLPTLASAELFVLFIPGLDGGYPNCDAFQSCAERSCAGQSEPALSDCWSACESGTAQSCAESRAAALMNGEFRFAVPWQPELDFGAQHRLASDDVSALLSDESCLERFPYGVVPACDDTVSTNCSVSEVGSPSCGLSWWSAAWGLALIGWWRHRASRRGTAG